VLRVSEANARQIVTRGRARLRGEPRRYVDAAEHRRLLQMFLAAAQTGELAALEQVLVADIAEEGCHARLAA
jgi:RNA polymerase sigma-70 factor (ECF subfamily)